MPSPLRVGIYARVSTSDRDQNPETQLLPLREFVSSHAYSIAGEFVDHASATDLKGRTAWRRRLLDQVSKHKLDQALVCSTSPWRTRGLKRGSSRREYAAAWRGRRSRARTSAGRRRATVSGKRCCPFSRPVRSVRPRRP